MRRNLIILTLLASAFVGCKTDPAPPTIDDAKVIWNNLNTRSGLKDKLELVDMNKTDGQMAEANGVKVYTLFYEVAGEASESTWGTGNPAISRLSSQIMDFRKPKRAGKGPTEPFLQTDPVLTEFWTVS